MKNQSINILSFGQFDYAFIRAIADAVEGEFHPTHMHIVGHRNGSVEYRPLLYLRPR